MFRSNIKNGCWFVAAGVLVGSGYLAPATGALTPKHLIIAFLLGLSTAIGLARLSSMGSLRVLPVTFFSLVAAVLVAQSVPLERDTHAEVQITATGLKNHVAKSSEVFVRLISEQVANIRDFEGDNWENRGDFYVSYQRQPSTLHYNGSWTQPAALRFVRHPYSGIVEVNINGASQRIDLFADKESYVDVPLPEATTSWKGYSQRGAIIAGLTLLLACIGVALRAVGSNLFGFVTYFLAIFAGCFALWTVKDQSYAGTAEIIAFAADAEFNRVEMDAGYGFSPALVVPVKTGISRSSSVPVTNQDKFDLEIDNGSLRAFHDLDAYSRVSSNQLYRVSGSELTSLGRSVYEVLGAEAKLWLNNGGKRHAISLLNENAKSSRLFILVEREQGQITVSVSSAFFLLSPWEHFSSWIKAIRAVSADGKPADKLVRLDSDGGYLICSPREDGSFVVPQLHRADSESFSAMKAMSVLLAISMVILFNFACKILIDLRNSYCAGKRIEVLLVLSASSFWVSVALAAGWPAMIGWDGFSPYIQAQTGELRLWYGIGYPLIVGGFLLLGSGAMITMFSAALSLIVLLGTAAVVMRYCERKICFLVAVLFAVVPPFTALGIGVLTHLRDSMNGLVLVAFSLSCFITALNWQDLLPCQRMLRVGGILMLGMALALLRIDNLPTILFIASALICVIAHNYRQSCGLVLLSWILWLSVNPFVEQYVIPDHVAAAAEKRTYQVTAFINPMVGVFAQGKDQMSDSERIHLGETLNKVVDVSVAEQKWTPYDIVYWHETASLRPVPDTKVISLLRNAYIKMAFEHPILFLKLRLATFIGILGHSWTAPDNFDFWIDFFDHLQSNNPFWNTVAETYGFAPNAHSFPWAAQSLRQWSSTVSSTVLPLFFCLIVALRFYRHPLTSIIAVGELIRIGIFFVLAPASIFMYLYDVHILGFLLPLMAIAESSARRFRAFQGGVS